MSNKRLQLKAARTLKNWTQEEAAQECGLKLKRYKSYELGARNPTRETAEHIAKVINIPVEQLKPFSDGEEDDAE